MSFFVYLKYSELLLLKKKKKVLYKYMLLPSISVKIQQENRLKYIILYLIRALSLILCRFFMFRIPENHIFSLNDHTFKQISQKKLYRTNVGDYLIFFIYCNT